MRSSWYRNGEDIFFTDEEFHQLAYRITSTYQRYLAELEHGFKRAHHEAWVRGWKHEYELGIGTQGQVFILPGYELRLLTSSTDKGNSYEATIILVYKKPISSVGRLLNPLKTVKPATLLQQASLIR